jgi:hypothetical protein
MNSPEPIFTSSTGFDVLLDRSEEQLVVGSDQTPRMRIDLRTGSVEILSSSDVSVVSGGRISLDGARGVDIRTGGDLQLIAEGETIVRGKMVRIN